MTEQLPTHYALDFVLDWLEETFSVSEKSLFRLSYEYRYLNQADFIKLLHDIYTKFNEFINHQENDALDEIQFKAGDLHQRFKTICKLLNGTE